MGNSTTKVHLFDIDIPGGITFKESDTLTPGDDGTVVDTDCGRLGIGAHVPRCSLAVSSPWFRLLIPAPARQSGLTPPPLLSVRRHLL